MAGVLLNGQFTEIASEYMVIVDKMQVYGWDYPDYLTPEEMKIVDHSLEFFDGLAEKMEEARGRENGI